jgi:iron complex outermembrane recepter protein
MSFDGVAQSQQHNVRTTFFVMTEKKAVYWRSGLTGAVVLFVCAAANLSAQTNALDTTPEQLKKMSIEDLMNLDVTSVAKQPEPYGEAPAAIEVITGDDIHRSGASSIPEALRLADNLDVAQVSSSAWDISARGFNASPGNKLPVLIDGRSVYTPLLSGVIWNMQDYLLEDIDRIEVISGPGGTLWGANAVNGVINIATKSAQDTQGFYLDAGGGSELQDFTGMRYGGTLASNVYFRIYGKYFDQASEVFDDGTSAHDSWNQGQGGFRIDDVASAQDHVTLQGDIFGGDTDTVPAGEGTPQAEGTSTGGNVLGRWTHTYADDANMSLQLYYDQTHLAAPFQSSGAIPSGTLFENLDTCDMDFQDRFPLGTWNNVVWGLGYRFTRDVVQDAPLVAFLPNRLDQNLYSGFLQDEIKLHDDVFLTLGSKLEHNDYTGFEYEPSGRVQWNITDKQMLWGAISRAVRTPSRYDRDLLEPSPAYGVFLGTNNSSFQSETVIAYELGYRAQLSQRVSGSLSTFYNHYDDLRSLSYTPKTFVPFYFGNNDEGNTYGFELSGNYQVFDFWRLHAGYDLLKEDIFIKPGYSDLYDALSDTADPQQQVFLRSSMDLPYRTELDASFRWIDIVHDNNGPTPEVVPAYAEMDVRLGWHATKHLEFSLVGQNLLHNRHPEAGYSGPTQEEIVRSVYGEMAWQF